MYKINFHCARLFKDIYLELKRKKKGYVSFYKSVCKLYYSSHGTHTFQYGHRNN